ncbi:hypothetical protein FRC09_018121, partial [Ceratobasidium sp. 395]
MHIVTNPLREACESGVEMLCADGRFRRGYPIVAGAVMDFPEGCMMACVEEGACPKCMQSHKGRGSYPMQAPPRSSTETLKALSEYFEHKDLGELEDSALKPWWPWWANLPYTDFSAALMPDVLHQLHQGMVKTHVVRWVRELVGKNRVDLCYMTMPTAEGMRHFNKGLSKLKGQWTGRESREVAKQLLPVAAGQRSIKLDPDLTGLTRSILEFSYRAHMSRMTDEDIDRLEETLGEFHHYKNVLIQQGLFKNDSRFDLIAKLHMLSHYAHCIREMGTPDNYSTEAPEHLHIRCAKQGWRASNKVRPTVQMVVFIQRYEALRIHRAYMNRWLGIEHGWNGRRQRRRSRVVFGEEVEGPMTGVWGGGGSGDGQGVCGHSSGDGGGDGDGENEGEDEGEEQERREQEEREADGPLMQLENNQGTVPDADQHVVYPSPHVSIPITPTAGSVQGLDIIGTYGAADLIPALHQYLNKNKPRQNIPSTFFPTAHHSFPVWHRLYLHHQPLPFDPEHRKRDVIRARPKSACLDEAFDIALLAYRPDEFGLQRYRAGRVRAIFSLPKGLEWLCPHPLVYVELFTQFSSTVTPFHCLNTTSHALTSERKRRVAIVSIHDVIAACHLAPQIRRLDNSVSLRSNPDLLSSNTGVLSNGRRVPNRPHNNVARSPRAVMHLAQHVRQRGVRPCDEISVSCERWGCVAPSFSVTHRPAAIHACGAELVNASQYLASHMSSRSGVHLFIVLFFFFSLTFFHPVRRLAIAYLFVKPLRQPDGEFPPSPLVRLAVAFLGPIVWNVVGPLVMLLISLFLGLMLNQRCLKLCAVMATIAHALAVIGMIAFFEFLWFLESWNAPHAVLGLIAVIAIQRAIHKTPISVFVLREFKHDQTNRMPAREYIVEIFDLSLWRGDFFLGHLLLFLLSTPTIIPYADQIHATGL